MIDLAYSKQNTLLGILNGSVVKYALLQYQQIQFDLLSQHYYSDLEFKG